MGMLRLMPRTLALRTVQRHRATSASARPPRRLQHGFLGGLPSSKLIKPLSRLAQAPSFSVSIGHLTIGGVYGVGGVGVYGVGGIGVGLGGFGVGPQPQAAARAKRRRLRARKRAAEAWDLDAMAQERV